MFVQIILLLLISAKVQVTTQDEDDGREQMDYQKQDIWWSSGRKLSQIDECSKESRDCVDGCYYSAIDRECSNLDESVEQGQQKIVGLNSSKAVAEDYPFMLSLRRQRENSDLSIIPNCYTHFCGAVLIWRDIALTAAHCLVNDRRTVINLDDEPFPKFNSKITASRFSQCRHQKGQDELFCEEAIVHPEYDKKTFNNDIAIIKLRGSMSTKYGFINLWASKNDDNILDARIVGFGATGFEKEITQEMTELKVANVQSIRSRLCKDLFQDIYQEPGSAQKVNETTMLCSQAYAADTCEGDSGGPLFFKQSDGKDYLLGITAWGSAQQCQVINQGQPPSVFARISFYKDWIVQTVNQLTRYRPYQIPQDNQDNQHFTAFQNLINASIFWHPKLSVIVSEVFHSNPSDDKLIGALKQSSATYLQKQEECDPFNQKAKCGPKVCRDIYPPGSGYSCEDYLRLGLCKMESFMTEGYCRKSCGKCCEDVVVPGVYNCFEVHKKQMCELDIVKKAGYCASTCGLCDKTGKAVKPPVNVSPVLDCLAHSSIECDRKALLQLKDMTSTWAQWQLGSWKADTHPCEGWKGITCITIKNVHRRVSSIQLGKYSWRIDENGGRQLVNNWENYVDKMDCPLPTYLSNMAFLEIISLQRVGMRGPIPHVFDLPNLKIVDLHFNFFDGPIPTQISQLEQLQVLDLSLNWITGSIPVGFSVLTNLERLDLWNNKLSGSLNPQFSTFEKLDWVNINNNKLVGSIPMQYSVWSSIQWFYADPQSGKQLCIPQQLEDIWHFDDAQTDIYQLHLCSQQQTLQSRQSQQW